ncbi:MAG: HypC/HybG/HupF family hydrogenase formation chaperone [Anaerovoracaceae bacterium]
MCVAYPGKIIEINESKGKADFSGNIIDVNLGVVEAKVGDYVLVHAGCAIEVMSKTKAEELIELFAEIEEIS